MNQVKSGDVQEQVSRGRERCVESVRYNKGKRDVRVFLYLLLDEERYSYEIEPYVRKTGGGITLNEVCEYT